MLMLLCVDPRRAAMRRLMALAVAAWTLSVGRPAVAAEVVFRDDFDAANLESGWTLIRENPSTNSLTAKPGFFRIDTERGTLGEDGSARNLLLRPMTGTFIIETRLEFNPRDGQQSAGLLIYLDDTHGVALGLAHATGDRGEFRGVALLSVSGLGDDTAQRAGAFYDETNAEDPNTIYLRLLRSGDLFVGAFSADGKIYTEIGTITADLPDEILVGVAAANGDFAGCGTECDLSIPADFDFVQISKLADNDTPDDARLVSVALVGPDEIVAGAGASFTAIATFDDGTSLDVTGLAEWMVAPPGLGQIELGVLTTFAQNAETQVTVVATYSQASVLAEVSRTDSTLVRLTIESAPVPPPPTMCGNGLAMVGPWMLGLMWWNSHSHRCGKKSRRAG